MQVDVNRNRHGWVYYWVVNYLKKGILCPSQKKFEMKRPLVITIELCSIRKTLEHRISIIAAGTEHVYVVIPAISIFSP